MKTIEELWQEYYGAVLFDKPEAAEPTSPIQLAFFAGALLSLREQYEHGGPVDPFFLGSQAREHMTMSQIALQGRG